MKKLVIFCLISFLSLVVCVRAENLEIEVKPNEIWVGDSVTISCWYSTTLNAPRTYIERTPATWNKTLKPENTTYYNTTFNPPDTLLGTYKVFCSNGTLNSSEVLFRQSKLTLNITDLPLIVYLGENLLLRAKIIETSDSERVVTSNVEFRVFLNEKSISINEDNTYPLDNEWVITTEKLPDINPSTYKLTVEAVFKGGTASERRGIEVRSPVQFELIDIDRTDIRPNDNITITLKASYKGNPIDLRNENLRFWINSVDCNIIEISRTGTYSYVKISTPNHPPGTYNFNIRFIYDVFIKDISKIIDYVIPVSGKILNSEGKPVNTQLKFIKDSIEKTIITDGTGSYSDYLPPGTYKIQLTFPEAKVLLTDVMINSFDDPIKFDNPTTDVDIQGIKNAGTFVFELALTYSDAYLELKYDDSKVVDETRIDVYKCKNWNFGKRVCGGNWTTVDAGIDTIRNTVKFNTSSLSAFVIGYRKGIYVDFVLDKDSYFLKDIIKIRGITEDEDGNAIGDVNIKVAINNTQVSASTKSDDSGVFSLEFVGPDKEGDYILTLKAEKSQYFKFVQDTGIKVFRSKTFYLSMADSVRVKQGGTLTVEASLVNTGQTDFSNLIVSLTGLPETFYSLEGTIDQLLSSEEKKIPITFTIPEDASKAMYSCNIKISSNENITVEKTFTLTIFAGNGTEQQPGNEPAFNFPVINFPTAQIVLPALGADIIYISLLGVFCFSFAYFMKRRKSKNTERAHIKNLLLDIRREIDREKKR